MYEYLATVVRVVDGDTVDIDIDLGFRIHTSQRVRLQGINAPEVSTQAGKDAKAYLANVLMPGDHVTVISSKPGAGDKYGRYLARIMDGATDISTMMVNTGHAVPWDGTGIKPV